MDDYNKLNSRERFHHIVEHANEYVYASVIILDGFIIHLGAIKKDEKYDEYVDPMPLDISDKSWKKSKYSFKLSTRWGLSFDVLWKQFQEFVGDAIVVWDRLNEVDEKYDTSAFQRTWSRFSKEPFSIGQTWIDSWSLRPGPHKKKTPSLNFRHSTDDQKIKTIYETAILEYGNCFNATFEAASLYLYFEEMNKLSKEEVDDYFRPNYGYIG
jgi:hypothetical protein